MKAIIAGNWKMNMDRQESLAFMEVMGKELNKSDEIRHMIFASPVMLNELNTIGKEVGIEIGCQNMHQESKGAFTGETSSEMLKSINIENILIGHSERRQYFNETDKIVNDKLKLAIEKNLKPMVCIGEILEERELNMTNQILEMQIKKAFEGITESQLEEVTIAYEPVWAIGTGMTATAEDANMACEFVRTTIEKLYSADAAVKMPILYGGSVSPSNVEDILGQENINGVLVGGASIDPESYLKLLP